MVMFESATLPLTLRCPAGWWLMVRASRIDQTICLKNGDSTQDLILRPGQTQFVKLRATDVEISAVGAAGAISYALVGPLAVIPRLIWSRLVAAVNGPAGLTRPLLSLLRLALSGQGSEIKRRFLLRAGVAHASALPSAADLMAYQQAGRERQRPWQGAVPQPIRLIMVTPNLARAGAPTSLFELTLGLKESGRFLPRLISYQDGPLRQEWQAAEVPVTIISQRPVLSLSDLDLNQQNLSAELARQPCDFVFANTIHSYGAIAAAWSANLPSLLNPRESDPAGDLFADLPPSLHGAILTTLASANRLIFVAETTRLAWQRYLAVDTAKVIANGLRPDRFLAELASGDRAAARASLGLPADALIVLSLGTLCARKGQKDLLEAMTLIPDTQGRQLIVALVGPVGDAYGRDILAQLAHRPAAQRPQIVQPGAVANPSLWYQAADIFVCSSRAESYPRVILEAMAAGLAIIATPIFGIQVMVRDGANGYLYPPGDTAELASLLARLLADPAERARLGQAARSSWQALPDYSAMVTGYADTIASCFSQP